MICKKFRTFNLFRTFNFRTIFISIGTKISDTLLKSTKVKSTKRRIFKSSVIAVLLYVFQHKCLRRLLKIYWPMRVSNEEVRKRANMETISEQVKRSRWTWIGHVL